MLADDRARKLVHVFLVYCGGGTVLGCGISGCVFECHSFEPETREKTILARKGGWGKKAWGTKRKRTGGRK